MKTIKLHYPAEPSYLNAHEFKIELPDGTFFDLNTISQHKPPFVYTIQVRPDGIYYQPCIWTGAHKEEMGDAVMLIPASDSDQIEFCFQQNTRQQKETFHPAINQGSINARKEYKTLTEPTLKPK